MIHFCCFQPPRPWCCVTTKPGNSHGCHLKSSRGSKLGLSVWCPNGCSGEKVHPLPPTWPVLRPHGKTHLCGSPVQMAEDGRCYLDFQVKRASFFDELIKLGRNAILTILSHFWKIQFATLHEGRDILPLLYYIHKI